ncbi:LacI family DNA-binding transcriptional regulator [Streptomyces sp. 3MP-14]|uniref:LacI family DNA-binding transcriptional regulator n=1 Tax=Streptomyces mimosae TaxID=2586635 RepID=A0A5N6A2F2_9ACTN|nr:MULTISPECIES: LacI family DNA-binding transcriptional regulator [Streptomyces]KAB8162957.1 LacI family DNA-binding transcriptional regulator [Streptomyces mimosae]KAB8179171.1 LacI family DNA-binding transcriptional regulator [Streptomyces sp. 3MP-14]
MAGAEGRRGRDGRLYYRARYERPDGQKGTVLGTDGKAIRYPTKASALKAARAAEDEVDAAAGRGRWVAPEKSRVTLNEHIYGRDGAGGWLTAQELAASSGQSYAHHIKRAISEFGDTALGDLTRTAIDAWERSEAAAGSASSAATYRRVLHVALEDAVEAGLIAANPAKRRRNRGRRAGRSTARGPERRITDALGLLLAAERAALLAGRDDEFVETILAGYTGMRWGEIVGLEPQFVRDDSIRIEWQLYELDSGALVRCPPKDDSYRDIDAPRWLTGLIRDHVARISPTPCPCHGIRYVYRGGAARTGRAGPTMADVARAAGVSVGTVSNVINRPHMVADATLARVEAAMSELGYVRGGTPQGTAAHWRRSGHAAWIWTPAVSGWYPKRGPAAPHPVPILAEPWPGVPARGRGAAGRATAGWVPISTGMTRHGRRHAHRTVLEEIGTPKVLMDERMGHSDSSVSARYAHVTPAMRRRLVVGLTEVWEESLAARRAMHPRSPVAVLDRLLG